MGHKVGCWSANSTRRMNSGNLSKIIHFILGSDREQVGINHLTLYVSLTHSAGLIKIVELCKSSRWIYLAQEPAVVIIISKLLHNCPWLGPVGPHGIRSLHACEEPVGIARRIIFGPDVFVLSKRCKVSWQLSEIWVGSFRKAGIRYGQGLTIIRLIGAFRDAVFGT